MKQVIPNPDLVSASRAFVPEFGNDGDLALVDRIFRLEQELRTVDNNVLRNHPDHRTPKMKEIIRKEGRLIRAIQDRIMDF